MARRLRIGTGNVGVKVDDGLRDAVEKVVQTAFKSTHDVLAKEAKEVYDDAYSAWPVKTGRSKAALRHGVRFVPPHTLKASVYVDPESEAAKYVYFIKTTRHRGKSVWVTLVRSPARQRARELSKKLGLRFRYSVGQKGRLKG